MYRVKLKLFVFYIVSAVTFSTGLADNKELVNKAKAELIGVNAQILKQIKNKDKFHNKKITVKVRRSKQNGNIRYFIENIESDSTDKPEMEREMNTFIIEGNLVKDKNEKFHFDIDHVIPPENDSGLDKKYKQ